MGAKADWRPGQINAETSLATIAGTKSRWNRLPATGRARTELQASLGDTRESGESHHVRPPGGGGGPSAGTAPSIPSTNDAPEGANVPLPPGLEGHLTVGVAHRRENPSEDKGESKEEWHDYEAARDRPTCPTPLVQSNRGHQAASARNQGESSELLEPPRRRAAGQAHVLDKCFPPFVGRPSTLRGQNALSGPRGPGPPPIYRVFGAAIVEGLRVSPITTM